MNTLKATFVLTIFWGSIKCRELNISRLLKQFDNSSDSKILDQNRLIIDTIDLKTFKDITIQTISATPITAMWE
jgi:hypothetical protein